jgi:hypothetical protein
MNIGKNGLRDFRYDREMLFSGNWTEFKSAVKRAFKRFWSGYDSLLCWNLNGELDAYAYSGVKWLLKHRHGFPMLHKCPGVGGSHCESCEHDCDKEFSRILRRIMWLLEEADERTCRQKNEYDGTFVMEMVCIGNRAEFLYTDKRLSDLYHERESELYAYRQRCRQRAWRIILRYYEYLWD